MTEVTLAAGDLRLALSPAVGGAVSAFETASPSGAFEPIMRRCPQPLRQVLDAACFPLVPYVNRIRGGSFEFRGREVRLVPNMKGDPSPLHGQGWLAPWNVERQDARSATLTFSHPSGEWPWRYEARQDFSLDEGGLSMSLSCRNAGDDPMPCGLGFHPYFPCGPEARLQTEVRSAWTVDEHVLPVARVPADGRYDLRDRAICGQDLDNGFGGWGGEARISDPDWSYDLRMSSPQAKFFQVYSPPGGGIFVAEPVTHANAALNEPESEWPELGLKVLEPGTHMQLDMRLDVIAKSLLSRG